MNAFLASPLPVWLIAACSTLGVIVRPFKLPEAVWAVLGALALCAAGLLPLHDAWRAVAKATTSTCFSPA
jgi:arsenical pump membrane protein